MDSRAYDVLIVDDDHVIRYYVSLCLTEAGFHCLDAGNGQEALNLLSNIPGSSRPGVALVDVRMPVLDGLGFAKEARKRNLLNKMELMFVTSEHMAPQVFIDSDSYDVLPKPHNMETLIPMIGRKLRQSFSDSAEVSRGVS